MEIDYKLFGQRIAEERKKNNFTQEQLAEKIGMSGNYISNIENNYSIPSLETLIKICTALNVTPDFLLLGAVYSSESYLEGKIAHKIKSCNDKERRLLVRFIDWLIDERSK